jgi:hypothetical protein
VFESSQRRSAPLGGQQTLADALALLCGKLLTATKGLWQRRYSAGLNEDTIITHLWPF